MKTRRELFKNLRTEMKTNVLNDCKEDLILISKYILKVYKRYNKLGKYLNICIMDDAITIMTKIFQLIFVLKRTETNESFLWNW